MIDAWRFVDADDDLVADLLAGTVELVLELGGWIHPEARILARDGQLRLTCEADDGVPLVRLPAEAFLPIGRVDWGVGDEALEVTGFSGSLTDVQHELLILQTALHNACGKIPWLVATHPVLAPDLDPALIEAVRAFRPSFRLRQPPPVSLFWSTRVFRLPAQGSDRPEPMALPIVDLLDHRSGGATGTWTGDAFVVDVRHAGGRPETWLDYGLHRDAIGMAVVYGFADESNPLAHSAPLRVDVPDVGTVRVLARGRSRTGELLPPAVTARDGGVEVSRVTFDVAGPDRAVRDLMQASTWDETRARAVLSAVAEANRQRVDALSQAAAASPSVAAGVLHAAAERQRHVIEASTT